MEKDQSAEDAVEFIITALKEQRFQKDLSYDSVAMLGKLNKSTVAALEKRRNAPTLLTTLKMCDGLGIKLSDILRLIGR